MLLRLQDRISFMPFFFFLLHRTFREVATRVRVLLYFLLRPSLSSQLCLAKLAPVAVCVLYMLYG